MKNTLLALSLVLSTILASATPFITRWDLSKTGSGPNQISFNDTITGTVNYTWETVPVSSNYGSGTLTNGTTTITGLPTNTIIKLKIDSANFNLFNLFNLTDNSRLVDVDQWGTVKWTSMNHTFYNCYNLNISATDIPNLNNVTNTGLMFAFCLNLNSPNNMNNWNTSKVTEMNGMFASASSFNQPIGNWNTSNVFVMLGMFYDAISFNQPIGNWNTNNVIDMSSMFFNDTSFNQPIGNWNTSNVTNMNGMFKNATSFNQPIGNWNTSKVSNMQWMFNYATSFNQPLDNWNISMVTNMYNMFNYATSFNQPIGNWNTNNVKDMTGMFQSATSFNQPIGNWNTSKVTDMTGMFYHATSFNQPIGDWNTTKLTNVNGMFYDATSFNQPLGNWNLKSVSYLQYFLDSSGMDCHNYAATLKGWANNTATPNNITLGASIIHYGTNVVADRNSLITTKGWTINGDIADATTCNATGITNTTPSNLFTISPNPTQGTLNINCSQAGTFTLYNMLGQAVYSTTLLGNNTKESKTLPSLPAALYNYILTAQNGERVVVNWKWNNKIEKNTFIYN